jgi:hypothetical protein
MKRPILVVVSHIGEEKKSGERESEEKASGKIYEH